MGRAENALPSFETATCAGTADLRAGVVNTSVDESM